MPSDLYSVKAIPKMGMGLVASIVIPEDHLITEAYTWLLTPDDCEKLTDTSLNGNYFTHFEDDKLGLLVIGDLSLANHSRDPNAYVDWRKHRDRYIVQLKASRKIKPGEQITIDYTYDPTKK